MFTLIRITEGQITPIQDSADIAELEREASRLNHESDSMNLFRVVIECQECGEFRDWEHCNDGVCEICQAEIDAAISEDRS